MNPPVVTNPDAIYNFNDPSELESVQRERLAAGLDPLIEVAREPDPGCKRCYGRGHVGKDVVTGRYVTCRCCRQKGKPSL